MLPKLRKSLKSFREIKKWKMYPLLHRSKNYFNFAMKARSTMRKSASDNLETPVSQTDKRKSERKLGIIAFALMLVGIVLPTLCFSVVGMVLQATGENAHAAIGPWFILGVTFEVAAFVMGVIAWPDSFGKATVITISIIVAALSFTVPTVFAILTMVAVLSFWIVRLVRRP